MKNLKLRKQVVQWIGREFVYLSCEGRRSGSAADEMEEIFDRFRGGLKEEGLTLDHTLRTRLWAVDRKSRDLASDVRAACNTGRARSATSSYIMPDHFASDARVAFDLIALRPRNSGMKKQIVENDPPRKPIDYLVFDNLVVLAGKTVVLPSLEAQLDEILPRIGGILARAGTRWRDVVNLSCYLHRSQRVETLRNGFTRWVKEPLARHAVAAVEGYSTEGKLIEIEVTAERRAL